ncbi:MAG: hypothetical protein PF689_03575 [Deltaproteobacteria bacterium]|jgi:hypothetical protein|nr:hypothetical protein [Deltaproteobacteria bacterium]
MKQPDLKGILLKNNKEGVFFFIGVFSLAYLLVYFVRFLGILVGLKTTVSLFLQDRKIIIQLKQICLGVPFQEKKMTVPLSRITAFSEGKEGDSALVYLGLVFMFYLFVLGMMQIFRGIYGGELAPVFWGFLLIISAFLVDFICNFLNHLLRERRGRISQLELQNGKTIKISRSSSSIDSLFQESQDI